MKEVAQGKKQSFSSGRVSFQKYLLVRIVYLVVDVLLLLPIFLITVVSRVSRRPIDVGLGPLPTINSQYHKQCLERFGYRCETFVYYTWYFTDAFDVNIGRYCPRAFGPYIAYIFCLFRYKCLYTYFTGGPLGFTTLLARCEPFLFRLAGIKTVLMPFGADVHVLTRTKNRLMVDAYSKDYPGLRHSHARTENMMDVWTHGADHIIAGCDWIDFMYYWDTLMLSHFAINLDDFVLARPEEKLDKPGGPLRLIHAPNHANLKGTYQIMKIVNELNAEGLPIELSVVQGVRHAEIPGLIQAADIVVDQLVLGWYAMFALEGMASAKPVICYIRQDLLEFYTDANLLEVDELPIVKSSLQTLKKTLRDLASMQRSELHELGLRSRAFVEKHHSLNSIGSVFNTINQSLGIPKSILRR